ncbi:MAG: hypothetical protein GW911_14105 [Armatimonadetes bacterium]|nr:hypothetical protein [Armatimonadota bacterium]NCP28457.1 hypothetical protein [Armatimonadota bacterium]NDK13158.1 hypothetical protein [Armatimonadota bacterium]PJB60338.1 MAG: hypothetical protein CO096_34470 [Armatimonadetes bacterium CG_4_9_14_3_um_filter_66_14]
MHSTSLALCTLFCCAASTQDALTLTKDLTLTQVLQKLDARTPAAVRIAEPDAELAAQYRCPPYLVGHRLPLTDIRKALDFLCGKGWEGSPLPQELRTNTSKRLARCPYRPDWEPGLWVCNNACWVWKWEKKAGGPAGGTLEVSRGVQADGDVVKTEPFSLAPVRPEYALNELLQMVKQKTRIVVNVDGNQYAPVPEPGGGKPRLEPMRLRDLPAPLQGKLGEPHTLGDFLTVLAEGLNSRTKGEGGLWKWSSSLVAGGSGKPTVIYTLRDYGRR